MKEYLVFLAQQHPNFRLAEIHALAQLIDLEVDLSQHDPTTPFLIVKIADEEKAKKWLSRAILTKAIYELWGHGDTEELLHQDVKARKEMNEWSKYEQSSFKFDFQGYQGSRPNKSKVKIMERFAYLPFEGPIRMKDPDEVFTVVEHYVPVTEHDSAEAPSHLYFGRLVSLTGRSTGMLEKYDLKKRNYIGTTTFEAELSLVSCNLAHVSPGDFMYDPFVGTGSFLVAGAAYGALTVGSDIDGRLIRGKGNNTKMQNDSEGKSQKKKKQGGEVKDIQSNFKQYGNKELFLDVLTMDFTHNAFRDTLKFDCIVCDPPYGIREGLKVLGARNPERFEGKETVEIDGMKAFLKRDYIPTKKPYALDDMLYDLLQFSSERLPVGRRLAFWMPTANDEDVETLIPQHKNLELVYHLEQVFNNWSRRLLVYVNKGDGFNGEDNRTATCLPEFRKRYFTKGFEKVEDQ
ncbi:hypothetical protein WICPIJ_008701 [Wickerhamomyces pijperi]|uniref:tRNA (guanine(10)-N(2))-methyltransferase n=1 Tax=Wickerhamomyces pijperi TaxID=599730 RepID=A0A9P8THP8_WICPI|nr:hypothetical protein WICPIJ_008701 [Wickerhamomyces pijperi]